MSNPVFSFEAGPYFLYLKKHYCINCGGILKRNIEKKYLTEDNFEAKKIKHEALYTFDSAPVGNITLYKYVFTCINCKITYSINDLKKRRLRKTN